MAPCGAPGEPLGVPSALRPWPESGTPQGKPERLALMGCRKGARPRYGVWGIFLLEEMEPGSDRIAWSTAGS